MPARPAPGGSRGGRVAQRDERGARPRLAAPRAAGRSPRRGAPTSSTTRCPPGPAGSACRRWRPSSTSRSCTTPRATAGSGGRSRAPASGGRARRPGRSSASREATAPTPSSCSARRASGSSWHTSGPGQAVAPSPAAAARARLPLRRRRRGTQEPARAARGLRRLRATVDDAPADLVLAGAASELATDAGPGVRGAGRPTRPRCSSSCAERARSCTRRSTRASASRCSRRWRSERRCSPCVAQAVAEVCGDAALLVEPDGLADGLVLPDADERAPRPPARGRTGPRRQFSWDASARLHEQAYAQAAGSAG